MASCGKPVYSRIVKIKSCEFFLSYLFLINCCPTKIYEGEIFSSLRNCEPRQPGPVLHYFTPKVKNQSSITGGKQICS